MTTYAMPICGVCTHLHRSERTGKSLIPWRCDAYPQGIPTDILHSRVDHRAPHAGDNAVLFEPRDKRAAEYAHVLFACDDAEEDSEESEE